MNEIKSLIMNWIELPYTSCGEFELQLPIKAQIVDLLNRGGFSWLIIVCDPSLYDSETRKFAIIDVDSKLTVNNEVAKLVGTITDTPNFIKQSHLSTTIYSGSEFGRVFDSMINQMNIITDELNKLQMNYNPKLLFEIIKINK